MRTVFTMALCVFSLLISACNTGPNLKSKKAYLDSDSYKSFSLVGGVPVAQTKRKSSQIKGSVQGKGLTGLPLRGVDVVLIDKNKRILKKVKTDENGEFEFLENLEDGDYTIEFEHLKKKQKRMVPLKGYKAKVLKVYFD